MNTAIAEAKEARSHGRSHEEGSGSGDAWPISPGACRATLRGPKLTGRGPYLSKGQISS